MADDAVATNNDSPGAGWAPDSLEQRVQRLEDAVASLQNTAPLEERITQRVTERLQGRAAPPAGFLADKITESRPLAMPPLGNSPVLTPPLPGPSLLRQTWLVFDALHGLWVTVRMFFDVRYHTAWSTRLTVIVLLVLILSSRLWLPFAGVLVVGPVLDKIVDLILAFFVYKVLSREAQRYLQFQAARAVSQGRS